VLKTFSVKPVNTIAAGNPPVAVTCFYYIVVAVLPEAIFPAISNKIANTLLGGCICKAKNRSYEKQFADKCSFNKCNI
jgi:hypothetical protein